MTKQQILVVEDDAAIRRGVVDALQFDGYDTLEASNGADGLEMALKVSCDLLLLDLVLPKRDGLEILRHVRAVRPALPVIILTARGEESDRVEGLRLGADDYVVKPFSVKELLARVDAVLRRSPERPKDILAIDFAGGSADLERLQIDYHDGDHCSLSETEGELLRYLACNCGRVVSRQEILSRVWRVNPAGMETRTVDMHIARLRKKLRDEKAHPKVLLTIRGKGYMFQDKKSTDESPSSNQRSNGAE